MRRIVTLFTILIFAVSVSGSDLKPKASKIAPLISDDVTMTQTVLTKNTNTAVGPGVVLYPDSRYENTTNSAVGRYIVNQGDGTLQVGAMEQTSGGAATRSTYWSYYDGNAWALPMTRVETIRSGWGNITTKSDGSAMVSSHVDDNTLGSQIAIDVLPGFGLWTYQYSGQFPADPASDHTWHRIAADGNDNIHIIFSYFNFEPFATLVPRVSQSYSYGRSIDGGLTWNFNTVFQAPGAAATDPPSQAVGWLTDGDSDSYDLATWNNKVGIIGWTWNNPEGAGTYRGSDILFSESLDNGVTWTTTNITNQGLTIPPEAGEDRAGEQMTLVYDNNGVPHAVFGTFFSFPDTLEDGTIVISQNRAYPLAPLMHWSPSTGVTRMLDRSGIAGALADTAGLNNAGGCDNYGRGSGGGLWWPSIAVDAENNLYVTFTAPTPIDFDANGLNYTDIYATASHDGGKTWGCPPVNVTNSVGTEDKVASLAKLVDANIHFVYNSDDVVGQIGGNGTQTVPNSLVYLNFPAADVPFVNECDTKVEEVRSLKPEGYALSQNYPNPFNPRTEIRFEIPVNGNVRLTVYNMVGQVVDKLVDDVLTAGTHQISWIAPADLSSGVYVYRLETKDVVINKKLLLMK